MKSVDNLPKVNKVYKEYEHEDINSKFKKSITTSNNEYGLNSKASSPGVTYRHIDSPPRF